MRLPSWKFPKLKTSWPSWRSVAGLSKQLQNQEQMLDALLRKNTELEVRSGVEGILLDVPESRKGRW